MRSEKAAMVRSLDLRGCRRRRDREERVIVVHAMALHLSTTARASRRSFWSSTDASESILSAPRVRIAGPAVRCMSAPAFRVCRGWRRAGPPAATRASPRPASHNVPLLSGAMSRRQQHTMNYPAGPSSAVDTALSLACLSEYAHTLDSLPIDLSRSYGDLRELDAVLSSSMTLLTAKINELIGMIETKTGTNDDRLYLLTEISEEATRLKLGGEDKIRVACHAADGLRSHRTHMRALLDRMPDREFLKIAEQLGRKTVYPHVTSKQYYPPGMTGEGGRRNRRQAGANTGYGGLLLNGTDPSPEKKKRRAPRDDDVDVTRTPSKKERLEGGPAPRQRNGARNKKVPAADRAASPTESVASLASHLPQHFVAQPNTVASNRAASNSASNKRAQEAAARRDAYSAQPPSTSHPSLPQPYLSNQTGIIPDPPSTRAMSNGIVSEWPHGQLEGPGMPVVRNTFPQVPAADGNDGTMSAGGEPDGDAEDNKTYCFCESVSYGEMIACDDEDCEREWFHIACVGLTVLPAGTWYCSKCLERRQNQKKSGRGGKKRSAGGRSAARNHAA
ncbi:hypothetical protein BD310DRAFT_918645 [Dichomitus squalens]|uniref:Chromatin modification-related protein n=2 Tax=Dichomitus squalens TaxID=114155 RepID=A0A4V2K949_9APHY|nr:hypothetical protein BD310DRAFT_918645 [Dichomitus squalens]